MTEGFRARLEATLGIPVLLVHLGFLFAGLECMAFKRTVKRVYCVRRWSPAPYLVRTMTLCCLSVCASEV